MSRLIILGLMLTPLISVQSQAQSFVDQSAYNSHCNQSGISCGQIQVVSEPYRETPTIIQPKVEKAVMGACGKELPLDKSYKAISHGLVCSDTSSSKEISRYPMPIDENKKNEADTLLESLNDSEYNRSRAQKLLSYDINWNFETQIPIFEKWSYTVIEGSFSGPNETYETLCSVDREETYVDYEEIYEEVCNDPIETYEDSSDSYNTSPSTLPTPSKPSSNWGGGSSSSSSKPSRSGGSSSSKNKSEKMKGTSSGEIEQRSRRNYENLKKKKDGAQLNQKASQIYRGIARFCQNSERIYKGKKEVYRTRALRPYTAKCIAQRPTWRTYPVTLTEQRFCGNKKLKITHEFTKDSQWSPKNSQYHDVLPNKYDLLPGESEVFKISLITKQKFINVITEDKESWNHYSFVQKNQASCNNLNPEEIKSDINTIERKLRRAPNPFKLPEGRSPIINLDSKGRPETLQLIDLLRQHRLEASKNSRRFNIGDSEAGGTKAFWVGTRFRMSLYSYDWAGRKTYVVIPNSFSVEQTDIFDNEMEVSLGGKGGMDRLYRPAGPISFLFGGIYKSLGVELSPNKEYYLEVQAAQREFPFYTSTCKNGEVACRDIEIEDSKYSEPILIKFKTGETKRSLLKKLQDLQFVIF